MGEPAEGGSAAGGESVGFWSDLLHGEDTAAPSVALSHGSTLALVDTVPLNPPFTRAAAKGAREARRKLNPLLASVMRGPPAVTGISVSPAGEVFAACSADRNLSVSLAEFVSATLSVRGVVLRAAQVLSLTDGRLICRGEGETEFTYECATALPQPESDAPMRRSCSFSAGGDRIAASQTNGRVR